MSIWLTLEEAAEYLKMGRSTLYRLTGEGQMPAHKRGRVWRFDAAELDVWMRQGNEAPCITAHPPPGTEGKP